MSGKAIIDTAGDVRSGEELDVTALRKWLDKELPEIKGTPKITQYAGGASNWTYRLEFENDDLILRRPPAGTRAKGAHDMGREYRLQKALKPVFPHVPEMRAYYGEDDVIGAEFYLMQRVAGIIPRKNLPRGLDMSADQVRQMCTNVLDTLIDLHKVDYKAAGLEELGAGKGYVERQITGWNKRYRNARTWNVPRGEKIMRWLENNMPEQETLCITHNDFRFDNVVLDENDPTRVIGVLDWELATIGDPLMDVGNMLAYWVEAGDDRLAKATRRQPTTLDGMMTRQEVINYYHSEMGFPKDNFAFYEVYGLFRLSAIAQQIYYRYHHKQTRNPAFKNFWIIIHYLHYRCRKIMKAAR
ncbi:phosphotransferase family protein [Amylibacter sp. SFDW26]|uniref:phosphotransferase family protein n=1 Tax=Amylibacter sp. SFDW26 TaxID=2652722 RepID=UPI0012623E35|nr:phosphotransferase family protein [Amylibacter sp. SFDW26]KAB7613372.1 phosphotransferase family protein [Amylibacter sp. SFDW26]